MTRQRTRRSGSPRCRSCGRPVVFFRNPLTRNWRPFEPKPVDETQQHPVAPFSIENNVWAWTFTALVEDLMMRSPMSRAEAEEHARAMPLHLPHRCPASPLEVTT